MQVFCGEINREASTETQKTRSVMKLICLTSDEQTDQRKRLKSATRTHNDTVYITTAATDAEVFSSACQNHREADGHKTPATQPEYRTEYLTKWPRHTHYSVYSHMCSSSCQLLSFQSRQHVVLWRRKRSSVSQPNLSLFIRGGFYWPKD